MSKTILVCGFGPGISKGVAEKFGAEGFSVAIVGRNEEKLAAGVKALEAKGIKAAAFTADLGDVKATKEMVQKARASLGPIEIVQWTAYAPAAGDLLTATAADIHAAFDVAVVGLITTIQESLADLKQAKGSVLVTNGGLAYATPEMDAMGVQWGAMGLGVVNAAKNKMVGLLHEKLKGDGVFVGQVMVNGSVKGTPFDQGGATLEGSQIAEKFWELHTKRKETTITIS